MRTLILSLCCLLFSVGSLHAEDTDRSQFDGRTTLALKAAAESPAHDAGRLIGGQWLLTQRNAHELVASFKCHFKGNLPTLHSRPCSLLQVSCFLYLEA